MDLRLQMMGDRQEPQDRRREGEGPSGIVLKRFSDWSKWIMVMISGIAATYYYLREEIAEHAISLYVMACRSLISFTFLADLALMLLTSYLLSHGRINERLYVSAKILIYITGILTMLTSASLLLLLNPNYDKLVTIMLGMQLVILSCYKGSNTCQAHEVTDYEAHQSKLKPSFDLSASVTIAAFGGMMATIYGYFKNFPKDVDQVSIRMSEVYIFFTVILGLLAMLLTTVPLSFPHRNARSHFIALIKVHDCVLFGLLALTGLSVAAEILEEFVLLASFPIFFAFVVCLSTDFEQEDGTSQAHSARGHESNPDTFSITIITISFAALIMTVYSEQFSSKVNDLHLQSCMFFMSSAFTSSLCWMLLAFRRPRTQSLAMAVKLLTNSTIVWMAVALLDFSLLGIRTSPTGNTSHKSRTIQEAEKGGMQ